MRLTVIGSSPAWPNPGGAQSGYLVEGPGRLLLDCGPGVLARLRQSGAAAVDAVAITHFHLDHWGDLVPWAWLSVYGRAALPRAELWLPPGGTEELAHFAGHWGTDAMFERAFDVREFGEAPFSAAGFEVEPCRVPHYTLRAYGFRIREGGQGSVLAYSGDSGPGEQLAALARRADLFLCEATLATGVGEGEPRGHLAAEEALAAADGRILLTHRPVELPPPDGVAVARDGLVVEL
ncbi:MAG: MBL fold metallo-hydrolase [Thermoleophilia bacterium]|nr:MBL fold metallo-hydrolase [Thermoleophilia bacterium]